jgi:hypothetical protein
MKTVAPEGRIFFEVNRLRLFPKVRSAHQKAGDFSSASHRFRIHQNIEPELHKDATRQQAG